MFLTKYKIVLCMRMLKMIWTYNIQLTLICNIKMKLTIESSIL